MKLLFCPLCQDVVKMIEREPRACHCGASHGVVAADGIHATIRGHAIPLGFDNSSLAGALRSRPEEGLGSRFEAFVIPEVCASVRKA